MRKFDLSLRSSRSSYFATFRHQLTILSKTDALDEEKWLNMLGTFVKDWFRYESHFVHCFFSSIRRHTRYIGDWSSDVCSSDLHVLRAKIDMASPNINMRDPVLFRIMNVPHYRQGSKWVIYPMYDYAHPLSDAIENITHSLCTLEFEDHRPLYDWCLEKLPVPSRPVQIEFARLNLSYTVLSKRKLLTLVTEGIVNGWDDPRMPTLSGLRRRGYTPEAIRNFCDSIGVAKRDAIVDVAQLEHAIRDDLNR